MEITLKTKRNLIDQPLMPEVDHQLVGGLLEAYVL